MLKAIYKEAWKSNWFWLDSGDMPLWTAHTYRDSMWWQTHRFLNPPCKRQKHGRAGVPRASWENPFLAVWGVEWQDRIAQHRSLGEWNSGFADFATKVCQLWNITLPVESPAQPVSNVWRSFRLPASIHDIPVLPDNPRERRWEKTFRQLWVQVDNQQLEKITEKSDLRACLVCMVPPFLADLDGRCRRPLKGSRSKHLQGRRFPQKVLTSIACPDQCKDRVQIQHHSLQHLERRCKDNDVVRPNGMVNKKAWFSMFIV